MSHKGRGDRKGQKRRYKLRHPEKIAAQRARNREKRANINALIVRMAKDEPCADCGHQFPPYVMDFDHVRGEKKFTISQRKTPSLDVLCDEIEKCDVVCANCHRIRTFTRRNDLKR